MAQQPRFIEPGTRAPGYLRAPQHRVAYVPSGATARACVGEQTIADSQDVVTIEEDGYPPREYFARADVDMSVLSKTAKVTFCPFKGLASYFDLHVGGRVIEDGAWSYEQPYREADVVRDRICFDGEKVSLTLAKTRPAGRCPAKAQP